MCNYYLREKTARRQAKDSLSTYDVLLMIYLLAELGVIKDVSNIELYQVQRVAKYGRQL